MKPNRLRILEYLTAQRLATPAEIGRALRLAPANVRHHLVILQQEGAVEAAGERRLNGRGRPQRLYAPSRLANLHAFDTLSDALLDELLLAAEPQALAGLLARLSARLAAPAAASSLSARLVAAIQRLNQLHYQARWEAHASAPRIILGHCPYRSLVDKRPELCRLDATLLETMLGRPVELLEKLAQDRRGAVRCLFRLKP